MNERNEIYILNEIRHKNVDKIVNISPLEGNDK